MMTKCRPPSGLLLMDVLLIIKNGFLVAGRYCNGRGAVASHNIKSVSKSLLSALTGIAG